MLGLQRWKAGTLLGAWIAYWVALIGVSIGPGLLEAWRLTRGPDPHLTMSASFDAGRLLLTVKNAVGTSGGWSLDASIANVLAWIAVPPLLLWVLWLVSRPRRGALPAGGAPLLDAPRPVMQEPQEKTGHAHVDRMLVLLFLLAPIAASLAQTSSQGPRRILAIGAHAGDMELTAGAVLLAQHARGDSIVLLHLTLGEGGNPKMSPLQYREQKRREAQAAAALLGARIIFGPYKDGELPNSEEARRYVAEVIREVKPALIITHWRASIHRDHANTHAIVEDAVLLASLEGVKLASPPHRGVRLWYAENWEDAEGFSPYLYVDVSAHMDRWRQLVSSYEFVRGGISSFAYLDYYGALATVRGAEAHRKRAEAFDIDQLGKKRVLDAVP
jgi:LmbE family N-acetylglucosaminyl deacetylase